MVAARAPIRQTGARIVGNWFGVKPGEIAVKERFFFGTGEAAAFFGLANLRRGHGGILPQESVSDMGKAGSDPAPGVAGDKVFRPRRGVIRLMENEGQAHHQGQSAGERKTVGDDDDIAVALVNQSD